MHVVEGPGMFCIRPSGGGEESLDELACRLDISTSSRRRVAARGCSVSRSSLVGGRRFLKIGASGPLLVAFNVLSPLPVFRGEEYGLL